MTDNTCDALEVRATQLDGVQLIVPEVFEDHRGAFIELFDKKLYAGVCAGIEFVQDDISVSRRGVLRGLHGDWRTTKLVSVLNGRAFILIADNREASPTYRKWQTFELSRDNRYQLLLPPGIGSALVALDDELIFHYKQSTHFEFGHQFTIRWDDPTWGFEWPIEDPILSDRDRSGGYVS